MKRVLLILSILFNFLSNSFAGNTDTIFAGILTYKRLEKIEFHVREGVYEVWTNGKKDFEMNINEKVAISAERDFVKIYSGDTLTSKNFLIRFNGTKDENIFGVRLLNERDTTIYKYEGGLLVTAVGKRLKLINIVSVEEYLKGVMKAECGELDEEEFLKAMAVVSRTYTLRNMYRHVGEGYDLCDKVHCQVYKGMNDVSDKIIKAIEETTDEVIVDKSRNLINAVFHSNSGGQTLGAESVWSSKESYLKSKSDPFSAYGIRYVWTKTISVEDFKKYISKKTGTAPPKLSLRTQFNRDDLYYSPEIKIPLNEMRNDLSFNSTYFISKQEGDYITFEGRGNGHGVGLSQEGASRMAKQGHKYNDIIRYYYSGIDIINYQTWKSWILTRKL